MGRQTNYQDNLFHEFEKLNKKLDEIVWPKKMKELFFRMNNTRKMAISYGLKGFDKDKIKEDIDEFDNKLKLSKEENKKISSNYYKTKSEQLYRRLKKYKKNHLYFIKNFEVPFDNNMSEQDLRIFKTKTKISGGFRSMKASKSLRKCTFHYKNFN